MGSSRRRSEWHCRAGLPQKQVVNVAQRGGIRAHCCSRGRADRRGVVLGFLDIGRLAPGEHSSCAIYQLALPRREMLAGESTACGCVAGPLRGFLPLTVSMNPLQLMAGRVDGRPSVGPEEVSAGAWARSSREAGMIGERGGSWGSTSGADRVWQGAERCAAGAGCRAGGGGALAGARRGAGSASTGQLLSRQSVSLRPQVSGYVQSIRVRRASRWRRGRSCWWRDPRGGSAGAARGAGPALLGGGEPGVCPDTGSALRRPSLRKGC